MLARLKYSSTLKFRQVYNWLFSDQCYLCLQTLNPTEHEASDQKTRGFAEGVVEGFSKGLLTNMPTSGRPTSGLCPDCTSALPFLETACPRCAEPNHHGQTCGHCLKEPPSFQGIVTPFTYEFPINHLIKQWKLRQQIKHGWILTVLAQQLGHLRFDVIVPVPSHWRRKIQRGRDQSLEIAQHLSKHLNCPVEQALSRTKATTTQRGLDKRQRRQNLKGAFALTRNVKGMNILLVDDVVTTGSTVELAAKTLQQGKPKSIMVACLAKTPTKRK